MSKPKKLKDTAELLQQIAELQAAIKANPQSPYNEIRRTAIKEKTKEFNELINQNDDENANQVFHTGQDHQ